MQQANTPYHVPALLKESVDYLITDPDGVYVDCTMGGGGHSREILSRLSEKGRLYGFDQDAEAAVNAPRDPRFTFIHANFRYLKNFLRYYGTGKINGILADLGVSFHHFDDSSRGFSFREDSPLDMRMNRQSKFTAADFVNGLSEEELREGLRKHTDLSRIAGITNAILTERGKKKIETTFQLAEAVRPVLNPKDTKKELAQIFQMFRILVNSEDDTLRSLLEQSKEWLRPGGRLAILTYHSGEDREVKNFMSGKDDSFNADMIYGKDKGSWKVLTRKPIVPSEDETERNPRSRSAKLRVAELIEK